MRTLLIAFVLLSMQLNIFALKSDTLDILEYQISLNITDFENEELRGNTELIFVSKINNLDYFKLDLLKFHIDSILFENENNTTYSYNNDSTEISITPASSLNDSDTFSVNIFYHGITQKDPSGWGGFYFENNLAYNLGVGFSDNPHSVGRYWFPCIDDFIDKAIYTYKITTKQNHIAVCGGTLIQQEETDTTNVFTWENNQPISAYLASVAVSDYVAVRDTFTSITNREIPIAIYVNQEDSSKAVASFVNIKQVAEAFEYYAGPYVFDRIGYSGTILGAMEHAENIAYPISCIDGTLNYEWLFAHELFHHWFGDNITCSLAEDMWINEGWAVYSESLYREYIYGRESFFAEREKVHFDVLTKAHVDDGGYYAVSGIPHEITYGTTVYDKGSDVVHSLRNYLGDELFFSSVKALLEEYQFKSVSSEEMRDFFTGYTGVNLEDFFNAFVFSPGWIHYQNAGVTINEVSGEYDITIDVKQNLKESETYMYKNKIPFAFVDEDLNRIDTSLFLADKEGAVSVTLPFAPALVLINPEGQIADATTKRITTINSSGLHAFPAEYCKFLVYDITDSVYTSVVHNFVGAPDTIKHISGLVKADNRYWTINTINKGDVNAKIKFDILPYGLDEEFMPEVLDSLVMIHRETPTAPWQIISATITSSSALTDSLFSGDFALAKWDMEAYKELLSVSDIKKETNKIKIHPNPSNYSFTISIPKDCKNVYFLNAYGEVIESIVPITNTVKWSPKQSGTYFIKIETSEEVYSSKLIKL